MALTLSPATEQRIQRETARGRYTAPDDLLNHALDLLEAKAEGDWLFQNRDDIRQRLAESISARDHGESYSPGTSQSPPFRPLTSPSTPASVLIFPA